MIEAIIGFVCGGITALVIGALVLRRWLVKSFERFW